MAHTPPPGPNIYQKFPPPEDRRDILLRAAYDILKQCIDSDYVMEVGHATAEYDGTTCDGYCLKSDIADLLDIDYD